MNGDVNKLRKTLSANIKKYRLELGLSQEKLAELIGLSEQTINNIEGCRSWISDKTLVNIASALKVEAYQLILPKTEADKLFPVRLPAEILHELRINIEKDMANRFGEILIEEK